MVYHLVYDKDKMSIFIMITMAYWILWRTREDSNLWPLPSEGSALSS